MAGLTEDHLRILPPAAKYLKKLKDKELKEKYKDAIKAILANPEIGREKTGDLKGTRGYDIRHNKTKYELLYTIEYVQVDEADVADEADVVDGQKEPNMVIVIMAGTRENFYDEVKRYWN